MRRGFSLIELVVSIVITGITLMSVPMLLTQTAINNNSAIIQESVMDAKTRMALVLKAPWGCFGNEPDFNIFGNLPTPVFGGLANFYNNNGISDNQRRSYLAINDAPAGVDSCAGTGQRLDSFAEILNINSAAGYNRDAIVNSTMTVAINRATDINGAANANTKEVVITVATAGTQSDGTGHTITLRAYSSNIGDSPAILTRAW